MAGKIRNAITEKTQTPPAAAAEVTPSAPDVQSVSASASAVDQDDLAARADLSHELRTSLAIITLLSGNLDLLYDRLDDRERRKMIRDIRKHTQRLNEMIAAVLALVCEEGPTPP